MTSVIFHDKRDVTLDEFKAALELVLCKPLKRGRLTHCPCRYCLERLCDKYYQVWGPDGHRQLDRKTTEYARRIGERVLGLPCHEDEDLI